MSKQSRLLFFALATVTHYCLIELHLIRRPDSHKIVWLFYRSHSQLGCIWPWIFTARWVLSMVSGGRPPPWRWLELVRWSYTSHLN